MTQVTKKVVPIDDADLTSHVLCMYQGTWHVQYELKANSVPQCICDLLDDLEKIKKAFPKEQDHPKKRER